LGSRRRISLSRSAAGLKASHPAHKEQTSPPPGELYPQDQAQKFVHVRIWRSPMAWGS
jgi:hypothetical protein